MPTKSPDDVRPLSAAAPSFDARVPAGSVAADAGLLDATQAVRPPSCASCHSATLPNAKFCHHCGSRLVQAAGADAGSPQFSAERRLVTILFCDLVNSVGMAAGRDPEDVADAMRQFHGTLSATMARFGGYFERPMGDGGLFYFGYPAAAEHDCERAVEAALETIDTIARLPPLLGTRLQVRIGIAAGVVVIGDLLGAADGGGHDVVGDVANLAPGCSRRPARAACRLATRCGNSPARRSSSRIWARPPCAAGPSRCSSGARYAASRPPTGSTPG